MVLTHPPNNSLIERLGVAFAYFRCDADERADPGDCDEQSANQKNAEGADEAVRALVRAAEPAVPQRFEYHFSLSGDRSARRSVRRLSPPRRSSGDRARSHLSVMNAVKPSISQ